MPRLFNLEVFNRVINGDNGTPPKYYSAMEHAAVLGSADMMNVQIIIESTPGATATVTVVYQINNDGSEETWSDSNVGTSVLLPGPTLAPVVQYMTISSLSDLGCYGRFRVTCDSSATSVRIIACGRSN